MVGGKVKPPQEGFTRTGTILGSWQRVVDLDYSTTQHSGECGSEQEVVEPGNSETKNRRLL